MLLRIDNTPRDYAWGVVSGISSLLGDRPSGTPEAELWLGSHSGSPSVIIDPSTVGGASDLREWVEADPRTALGHHTRLPFLMKVLAAGSPLSLQAHPSDEQAARGFAREDASGIPVDAPERNYRDPHAKPEIIVAVSETFEALCGFRPLAETRELFEALGLPALAERLTDLPALVEWLITRGEGVDALVGQVSALAEAAPPAASPAALEALDTVRMLASEYSGDPGIVIALLLNRVSLRRGEALFLPAGNIHTYLRGVGIEVMGPSDNVLRGGLTRKHVDAPELLEVLDFSSISPPYLRPTGHSPVEFRPEGTGFALAYITDGASYSLTGPAIALCLSGGFRVAGERGAIELAQGDAVYVTPDEATLAFEGSGELFLATSA